MNWDAALAEYDKLKTLLRRELAVEPLPETDEGVRRLLAHEGVHGWPKPNDSNATHDSGERIAATPTRVKQPAGGSSS